MSSFQVSSLSDVRVVEVAGDFGGLAGKMYADLGTDVIRVESPAGDPTRRLPPFLHGATEREGSLHYLHQNTNKRGMVLDLFRPEGQEIFKRLVNTADILLEQMPPKSMGRLGLDYEALRESNPRLVYVSMTPFGQYGPYRDHPGDDMTCMAMGGLLFLGGTGDEKPVLAYGQQAFTMAPLYAAVGSMMALYHAEATGVGQYIDISAQDCVATALETAAQVWDLEGGIRRGAGNTEAGFGIYRCQDGYVSLAAAIGTARYYWDALVNWITDEGIAEAESLRHPEWYRPDYRKTPEAQAKFKEVFEDFSRRHGKQYLYEEGQRRKVVCYPVNTPQDVVENPQLKFRGFYKVLQGVTYVGAPYELEKVQWKLSRPAPRFGEHTREILRELHYTEVEIDALLRGGVVVD